SVIGAARTRPECLSPLAWAAGYRRVQAGAEDRAETYRWRRRARTAEAGAAIGENSQPALGAHAGGQLGEREIAQCRIEDLHRIALLEPVEVDAQTQLQLGCTHRLRARRERVLGGRHAVHHPDAAAAVRHHQPTRRPAERQWIAVRGAEE